MVEYQSPTLAATPEVLAQAVRGLADLIEAGHIGRVAREQADQVRRMALHLLNDPSTDQCAAYHDLAARMPAIMGKAPSKTKPPPASELRRLAGRIEGVTPQARPIQDRSVSMTLAQVRDVFGYSSDNGIKAQTKRIGLVNDSRASWTFRLSAMTSDERKRYEQAKRDGLYAIGKRL